MDRKLFRYLPQNLYINNEEIKETMNSEQEEIVSLYDLLYNYYNRNFVLNTDEQGVKNWEKIFNIVPDEETQDLDYRKDKIISRLTTHNKYTERTMIVLVNEILGEKWDYKLEYNLYNIIFNIQPSIKDRQNELKLLLKKILPANLTYHIDIKYNIYKTLNPFMQKELKKFTHYELRNIPLNVEKDYLNKHSKYDKYVHQELKKLTHSETRRKGDWYNG